MRSNLKNRVFQLIIFLVFVFVCFKKGSQNLEYKIYLPNQHPKAVWEFLADFSNIVKLNPRISSWQLLSEKIQRREGAKPAWVYNIIFHERMFGDFLFGVNENHGEISVEELDPHGGHYRINEVYRTLSFRKNIVVNNWVKIDLKKVKINGEMATLFEQKIGMDCPLIFSYICIYETNKNREDFLNNLQLAFK